MSFFYNNVDNLMSTVSSSLISVASCIADE